MKTFLLLLLVKVIPLVGCAKPIGCGQSVLSIYSNVATSNGTRLNDINSMLLNHKTSMFELKQASMTLPAQIPVVSMTISSNLLK